MMRIAVIGAGNLDKALGRALAAKGHDVVFGVRDPERSGAKPAEAVQGNSGGRCHHPRHSLRRNRFLAGSIQRRWPERW